MSNQSKLQMTCRRQFWKKMLTNHKQPTICAWYCLLSYHWLRHKLALQWEAGVHSAHKHCFAVLSACITNCSCQVRASISRQSVSNCHTVCVHQVSNVSIRNNGQFSKILKQIDGFNTCTDLKRTIAALIFEKAVKPLLFHDTARIIVAEWNISVGSTIHTNKTE